MGTDHQGRQHHDRIAPAAPAEEITDEVLSRGMLLVLALSVGTAERAAAQASDYPSSRSPSSCRSRPAA